MLFCRLRSTQITTTAMMMTARAAATGTTRLRLVRKCMMAACPRSCWSSPTSRAGARVPEQGGPCTQWVKLYQAIYMYRNTPRLRYAKSVLLLLGGMIHNSADSHPTQVMDLCYHLLPVQYTKFTYQLRKFLVHRFLSLDACSTGRLGDWGFRSVTSSRGSGTVQDDVTIRKHNQDSFYNSGQGVD